MSVGGDSLNLIDLGRMKYAEAFDYQRQVHAEVVSGDAPPTLIFVEHDPVITISRRKTASQHLLVDDAVLKEYGIDVQPTDRGGDITYHGPGQLVAYPIVRLNALRLNVGRYMQTLEQIVIDTLGTFGVEGRRDDAGTGVWVSESGKPEVGSGNAKCEIQDEEAIRLADDRRSPLAEAREPSGAAPAKIAAIGVRISRGVSLHGLALNVTTDLSHFDTIVPCGLAGRSVTSFEQLLADGTPSMETVKTALAAAANNRLTVGHQDAK